jgi:ATPase family AAA domain-containing protein 3A/B
MKSQNREHTSFKSVCFKRRNYWPVRKFVKFFLFLIILVFEKNLYPTQEGQTDVFAGAQNILNMKDKLEGGLREEAEHFRTYFDRRKEVLDGKERALNVRKKDISTLRSKDPEGYRQELQELEREQARYERERAQYDYDFKSARERYDRIERMGENIVGGLWEVMMGKERAKKEAIVAAVRQDVENQGRIDLFREQLKTDNLVKNGLFYALTAAGVLTSYYGLSLVYKYLKAKLFVPTLVIESSRHGLWDSFSEFIYGTPDSSHAFDDIVFAPELEKQVKQIAQSVKKIHENEALNYRNLLFWGPPGTGKTLVAKTIARTSGMDYAIIPAARFRQYELADAIKMLNEVFDWAENGKRGLALFFDETSALCAPRGGGDKAGDLLVEALLARFNSSSNKFMIIFAANNPELDEAVLSRIDKVIEVPLPGDSERERLILLYVKKYLTKGILGVKEILTSQRIIEAVKSTEGFSGRDIEKFVGELLSRAMTENKTLTGAIWDDVLREKIVQHKQTLEWTNSVNSKNKAQYHKAFA